ncbi:MAG: tetratricopeptide repeat protein [Acidobacteria bacterium]|nr:tetratricopeptide repeat protein [Acidobacteriota bacterium]
MFLLVCEAVQHAHQRGIIHRDLKPANVLVSGEDGRAAPKIIDFGIAKALDNRLGSRPLQTRYGDLIGTPEFMSPEQVYSPLDVDTRSDVYSLGALLYMLVAGCVPRDFRSAHTQGEMLRILSEVEVTLPSRRVDAADAHSIEAALQRRTQPEALRRRLAGDLDWIVMKALAREREQRYGSAAALAADIENHMRERPVTAAPPAAIYRIGKFIRRHRVGVAVASTAVLLLVGFVGIIAVQSLRVARALAQAEQVTALLVGQFQLSDPLAGRPGAVTARELLDQSARRVSETLQDQPEVRASLLMAIGQIYRNLGVYDRAGPLLEEALKLQRARLGSQSPDVAASLHKLGAVLDAKGDYRGAEPLLREALAIRRKRLNTRDNRIAETLLLLGSTLRQSNNLGGAEDALREALSIRRSPNGADRLGESAVLDQLAAVLRVRANFSEADRVYREALQIRRGLPEYEVAMSDTLNNYGGFLVERGELQTAEPLLREALEIRKRRLGQDHPRSLTAMNNLALSLFQQGDLENAEAMYRTGLSLARQRYGAENAQVATTLNNLALVMEDRGDLRGAARLFRETLAMQLKV